MPAAFSSTYFNLYNSYANTAEFAPYYGAMSVFGMNNTAMGRATMAIGNGNAAITPYSFVAGKGNFTTEYGQTVVGCWRDTSGIPSARFIVAGGSSNTSRKNLLEVADNKIYTPCDVYIDGDVTSNNHYVNGSISATSGIANTVSSHFIPVQDSVWYVTNLSPNINNYVSSGVTNLYFCHTATNGTATVGWSSLLKDVKYHFTRLGTTGKYTIKITGIPSNTIAHSKASSASWSGSNEIIINGNTAKENHLDLVIASTDNRIFWDRY